ncbi:MAG: serine/threonine protein kinase [Verrucomicrobiales bacterium]|nr:serine/threonine protein kinase [Verrucomicrobiales bacterium]
MPTQDQAPLINGCPECGESIDVSDLSPYSKIVCPHCKSSIRVRTSLGQYQIQRLLGEGGMSQVFLAKDVTLGRMVALKVLHKELSRDEKLTASFEREAKITASINHPNVVKVYTVGSDYGYFFIAMELVDNMSLEELITNQDKVPQLQVAQIAHDVTSGLYAAFKAGLIHRDIKPGNILLTNDGHAKLVDFGLAVQTGHFDEDEDVWATPFYVPPEKLDGQPDDFRGDIYSLGATLFHAVSGTPPYAANTASLDELKKIKAKTIRLVESAPDARKRMCRLIDRMMARSPSSRYQDYKSLLAEIVEVENKLGSRRRSATAIRGLGDSPKTETGRPAWLMPTVIAGAGVVLAGILLFAFSGDTEEDLNETLLLGGEERVLVAGEQNSAARYVEARNLLEKGKLKKAQQAFQSILKAGDLKEPTRTWTKFSLGLSLLLQGNEKQARTVFADLATEKEDQDSEAKEEALKLMAFFKQCGSSLSEVLPVPNGAQKTSEQALPYEGVANLAYGLKNWNQGQFASALRFFKLFKSTSFPEPYTWIESFKEQADLYLNDGKMLSSLPNPRLQMSEEKLGQVKGQLQQALEKLKTGGAAQSLLKGRIERSQSLVVEKKRVIALKDAQEKEKTLASRPVAVLPSPPAMTTGKARVTDDPASMPPKLGDAESMELDATSLKELEKLRSVEQVAKALGANFEFPQAMSRFELIQLKTPVGMQLLADDMQITKQAEDFLQAVIGKLDEGKFEGQVIRKEGAVLEARITAATRESLIVDMGFGGNEVLLEEFSPAWILSVARESFGSAILKDPDLIAQAACFAWATDEADTASKIVAKGEGYSDEFKALWERLAQRPAEVSEDD